MPAWKKIFDRGPAKLIQKNNRLHCRYSDPVPRVEAGSRPLENQEYHSDTNVGGICYGSDSEGGELPS
jgi:hypothetical protein